MRIEKVERNLNGWIDCNDELPHYNVRVLIYIENTDETVIGNLIQTKRKNGTITYVWELDNCNEYGTDSPYLDLDDVDFWQPIPIAPDPKPPFDPSWTFGKGNTCIGLNADINLPDNEKDKMTTGEGEPFGWSIKQIRGESDEVD